MCICQLKIIIYLLKQYQIRMAKAVRHDEVDTEILEQKVSIKEESMFRKIIQNLDKILIIILTFLMIYFFLRDGGKRQTVYSSSKINVAIHDQLPKQKSLEMDKKSGRDGKLSDGTQTIDPIKSKIKIVDQIAKETMNSNKDRQNLQQNPSFDDGELIDSQFYDSELQSPIKPKLNAEMQERERFRSQRTQLFKQNQNQNLKLQWLHLAKYNYAIFSPLSQISNQHRNEADRLELKYQFAQVEQELSICVLIYGEWREEALNSVINQQYGRLQVIIIADGWNINKTTQVKEYIKTQKLGQKVEVLQYQQPLGELNAIHKTIGSHCFGRTVTVLMRMNQELLGRQVFRVINAVYHQMNANIVYSNFLEYDPLQKLLKIGGNSQYKKDQPTEGQYRNSGVLFGPLLTFKTKLLDFIKLNDLKDSSGMFYRSATREALMFPLLELSCGKVQYVGQYNCLTTRQSSTIRHNGELQQLRYKSHYKCFKKYK